MASQIQKSLIQLGYTFGHGIVVEQDSSKITWISLRKFIWYLQAFLLNYFVPRLLAKIED